MRSLKLRLIAVLAVAALFWPVSYVEARGGRGGPGRAGPNRNSRRSTQRREEQERNRREERLARARLARIAYAKRERRIIWKAEVREGLQADLFRLLRGLTE